jgi:hypothetical protein
VPTAIAGAVAAANLALIGLDVAAVRATLVPDEAALVAAGPATEAPREVVPHA